MDTAPRAELDNAKDQLGSRGERRKDSKKKDSSKGASKGAQHDTADTNVAEEVSTVVDEVQSETSTPATQIDRQQRAHESRRGSRGVGIEHAAAHLLGAATGWLFMAVARAVRGKQRRVHAAQVELETARALLAQREAALQTATEREQEVLGEAHAQASAAQTAAAEVTAANTRCEEAARNLERTLSDLKSTREELLAARSQLQAAMNEVAAARQRGEAAEGELGLTRSENELLRRELQRMRSQLESATHALERHRQGARVGGHHDGMLGHPGWGEADGLGGGGWVGVDDASSLGGYGSEDDRV